MSSDSSDSLKSQDMRKFHLCFGKDKLQLIVDLREPKSELIREICEKVEKMNKEKKEVPLWMTNETFSKFIEFSSQPVYYFGNNSWATVKLKLWHANFFNIVPLIQRFLVYETVPRLSNGISYALGYEIQKKLIQNQLQHLDWAWLYTLIKCHQCIFYGVKDISSLILANKSIGLAWDSVFYTIHLNSLVSCSRIFNVSKKSKEEIMEILNHLFGSSDLYVCLSQSNKLGYEVSDEHFNLVTWRVQRKLFENKESIRSQSFLMGDHYFYFQVSMVETWYSVNLVFEKPKFNGEICLQNNEGELSPSVNYFEDFNFEILSFVGKLLIPGSVSTNDFGFSLAAQAGYSISLGRIYKSAVKKGTVPMIFVNLKYRPNLTHSWLLHLFVRNHEEAFDEKNPQFKRLSRYDIKIFLEFLKHKATKLSQKTDLEELSIIKNFSSPFF